MSSMKKNTLAAALVASLGLAGGAAAYNYGTNGDNPSGGPGATDGASALPDAENVAYQMLFSPSYNYTMTEGIVFDIEVPDNAANIGDSFTVRIALNSRCTPHDAMTNPVSPATNVPVCTNTGDGARFNAAPAPGDMVLDPSLVGSWTVAFDGYTAGHGGANTVATFRLTPLTPNPVNPSSGTLLTWNNVSLTSLDEFASGATSKVDAEFWMVNIGNDARFVNSTMSRTIIERVSGVTACADSDDAETDKYIDVADSFYEEQLPKTRFSEDGKLGTAEDVDLNGFAAGRGEASQTIDLGDVTITNNGAGNFAFLGTDTFTTVITGSNGDDWNAFDHVGVWDDVYLVNGTCSSGAIVTLTNGGQGGTVSGNSVTFQYTAAAAGVPLVAGLNEHRLTVCAFQDTDIVIDDHPNHVTTTFFRSNAIPTPAFADVHDSNVCDLLPLRYNGSTMEIFTINPGSNTTQRSFIRLTNRSSTDGYVSLEGIDNGGNRGESQVRVWVEAGASVQLDAKDLEEGTNGAIGAWGTSPVGKWRAVVTAEFPGLVATSLVNTSGDRTLQNITDSDTRGEQIGRDWAEGTWGNEIGERPSDYVQEFEPDFHGNGNETDEPGGPNGSDGPTGGQSAPDGNPGLD